jgi:hypothetical protein
VQAQGLLIRPLSVCGMLGSIWESTLFEIQREWLQQQLETTYLVGAADLVCQQQKTLSVARLTDERVKRGDASCLAPMPAPYDSSSLYCSSLAFHMLWIICCQPVLMACSCHRFSAEDMPPCYKGSPATSIMHMPPPELVTWQE